MSADFSVHWLFIDQITPVNGYRSSQRLCCIHGGEVIFDMLAIKKHNQSKFKRISNSHELVSHYFFEIACVVRLLVGGRASLHLM